MLFSPLRLLFILVVGFATTGWQKWSLPMMLYAKFSQSGQRELASAASFQLAERSIDERLAKAALNRAGEVLRYDDSYQKISFPMGDVPTNTGSAADEIIRIYREIGIDLQTAVYTDMVKSFDSYPHKKEKREPDTNIDHRMISNLRTFFNRVNASRPVTREAEDYQPGDIITCCLPDGRSHIAMVVPSPTGGQPWIVHNMVCGPRLEDKLFDFTITGHYRYLPGY